MYQKIGMAVLAVCLSAVLSVGCRDTSSETPFIDSSFPTSASSQTAAPSGGTTSSSAQTEVPTAPTAVPTDTPTAPTAAPTSAQTETPSAKASAIADLANQLIGTSFKIGGVGPDEFDNSGFVYYCCQQNGVAVPRTASGIVNAGTEISRESLIPGDIVVFANEIGGDAAFVGIFAGNGKFIACNNPSTPTKAQNINSSYWKARFLCGRRVA